MSRFLIAAFAICLSVLPAQARELVVKESPYSVSETLDRLTKVLEGKGIKIFARVDHAAGAAEVGETLRPTELLLFGNPKLGTPLMAADQRAGIDLPMKALAWQDEAGKVWLGYLDPKVLMARHRLSGANNVLTTITGALGKLTDAALKSE